MWKLLEHCYTYTEVLVLFQLRQCLKIEADYAMIKYKTCCQYRKENQQFSKPQSHFRGAMLVWSTWYFPDFHNTRDENCVKSKTVGSCI